MVVEGLTAEQVSAGLDKLMFGQNKEYDFINLLACPDHYALRPLGDSRLEVIETTGGSPFPIQFLLTTVKKRNYESHVTILIHFNRSVLQNFMTEQ